MDELGMLRFGVVFLPVGWGGWGSTEEAYTLTGSIMGFIEDNCHWEWVDRSDLLLNNASSTGHTD